MQARDEGLLDLDDPLSAHLGRRRLRRGDRPRRARPRLGHAERAARPVVGAHPRQRLRGARRRQRRLRPGRRRRGSGSTTPTSATACSARSSPGGSARRGATWSHDRLLRPLGMRSTSYLPRPGAQPGWSVDHFTGIRVHEPLTETGAMAPAGQLWSTLADLVTWGQVLAGVRPQVLAPATLGEMQRPVTADYGLGLMLGVHPGGRLVGHDGSMPGFIAVAPRRPRQRHRRRGAHQRDDRASTPQRPRGLADRGRPRRRRRAARPRGGPPSRCPREVARCARGSGSGATRPTTCAGTTTGLELRAMARGGVL